MMTFKTENLKYVQKNEIYMSLTLQHRQEVLSIAYVSAVAAKAGYNCGRPGGYDYGTDLEIKTVESSNGMMYETGLPLYIQAKASYNYSVSTDNLFIIYDLDVKTYNKLIRDNPIPRILVLYCMPNDQNEWMMVCEEQTILKKCGYWVSLKGFPPSENDRTLRILVPRQQVFNESSLEYIMHCIANGDSL